MNRTNYNKQLSKAKKTTPPQLTANKKVDNNTGEVLEKVTAHLRADDVSLAKTLSTQKHAGRYQTFMRELLKVAIKDKNVLKQMGIVEPK